MSVPRLIADFACHTGENPLWHTDEQRLYWTDIPAGRLFTHDPAAGGSRQVYSGRPVGGFTFQADGALLLFQDRGTVTIWREGAAPREVVRQLDDELDNRFNDVIADPLGNVFCGTMSVKDAAGNILRWGRLYHLDARGRVVQLLDHVGTSNGLGFSPDRRTMYYTDTRALTIYQFDYDAATGAISYQRPFIEVPNAPGEGRPDGMTVDAEGNIWGARWDGGAVVCYAPDGKELRRIKLPCPKVSCVTFGGTDFRTLFITTAGGQLRDTDGPLAGGLFAVEPGVAGVPEFRSRALLS